MANDATISQHWFVVEQEWLGIIKLELQEPARKTRIPPGKHGVTADEVPKASLLLLRLDDEAEAGFEHMVLVRDIMTKMTIGLLKPQGIHCQDAGRSQRVQLSHLQDGTNDMPRKLGGDIKFKAEFANIADAMRTHMRHADLDAALRPEWKSRVRDIIWTERLQQRPRCWTHQRYAGLSAANIDRHAARLVGRLPPEPGKVAADGCCTRHDKERGVGKTRDRDVRFDATTLIKPLRVNDAPRLGGDVIG